MLNQNYSMTYRLIVALFYLCSTVVSAVAYEKQRQLPGENTQTGKNAQDPDCFESYVRCLERPRNTTDRRRHGEISEFVFHVIDHCIERQNDEELFAFDETTIASVANLYLVRWFGRSIGTKWNGRRKIKFWQAFKWDATQTRLNARQLLQTLNV